ncbi:MAG TPA: bifunctional phosphoglucose/phosphomannose isomerase [Patescibacteria group bacterium]|nr:bifunctional phosphoglucose/phosphomannose isomerase [Patescibacteria group bacterium]
MNTLNLQDVILHFPQQFEQALECTKNIKISPQPQVIICGMGGSALPADIIITYLAYKKIHLPIVVCRTYTLPWQANKQSVIFISSYSGNTEEALSCYKEAKEKGYSMVGFAKGGKLEALCIQDGVPFVKYPDDGPDFQPRFGLGYAFAAMLQVLSNSHIIPDCTQELQMLATTIHPKNCETQGKELAKQSKNVVPIFYSSDVFGESVARICKILINENSKTLAFWNVLPELNHNEMVGYTNIIGSYHVILIHNSYDHPRVMKRFSILHELFTEKGIAVSELHMQGNTTLEQIFNTIFTIAWMSYYLALEYGQDPVPVVLVEEFKKKMA